MRKIVSLLLAAVCAVSMTATAFAENPKIAAQKSAISGFDVGERGPGYKIWIPLGKDAFQDATEDLTMADVKASKITVKQSAKSGSDAIASVEIKEDSNKIANILITLTNPFTSTKPLDFETSIYLSIDGVRQNFSTVVTGTLVNPEIVVTADTDYVNLSDGQTVRCEETSGKVEAYIGRDVSIFIKMLKGKDYYGTVTNEPTGADMDVMDKYPDVEDVLNLKTINLNGSGNIVKIDSPDTNYHVYNSNLEYIGKTSDMLPYSTKYYLAAKELDVDEAVDEAEPEDEDENEADGTEPSDEPAVNPDDEDVYANVSPQPGNPDTGASSFLGAAFALSALSLGGIVTVTKRKNK